MAEEKVLPQGIRFFDKNPKAPDFVLGSMVITMNELIKFAQENPDYLTEYQSQKQLRLEILKSKKGGIYATVNTYKPAGGSKAPVDDLPF